MKFHYIVLVLIIVFASMLRLWGLGEIPPGVNRDEASIGYTAYSLLRTGRDEYGTFLPLSIKSFGDWKLPLYIYASIIPIALFGLSDFSVRLISALAGISAVMLVYFLTKSFLQKHPAGKHSGLIAAFLLAISPWHIHFSRVASEANTAVLLTIVGLWCFIQSFTKHWLLIASALFFSATLFTYHGSHIFTPLFLLCLFFMYRKEILVNPWAKISIGLLGILAFVIFSQTLLHADKTKLSGISILSDPSIIHAEVELPRAFHQERFVSQIFHNKFFLVMQKIILNYVRSYSPEFLYVHGAGNRAHNIPNVGNAYLVELPFFLFGLYCLLRQRSAGSIFLLLWLAIAPVAPSITKDAPHSARMLSVIPALQITTALGLGVALLEMQKFKRIGHIPLIILGISLVFYLDNYMVHFPKTSSADWGVGYKDVAQYLRDHKGEYTRVVFARPDYSPYIFLAFYSAYDPRLVIGDVERYPMTREGFHHVTRLGNISFRNPDYLKDLCTPGTLVVNWSEDVQISSGKKSLSADQIKAMNTFIQSRIVKHVQTLGHQPLFTILSSGDGRDGVCMSTAYEEINQ